MSPRAEGGTQAAPKPKSDRVPPKSLALARSHPVKHAHWNVKGPEFIALHKLFDEINDAVVEYVDTIAERPVQPGGVVQGTARSVAKRSTPA